MLSPSLWIKLSAKPILDIDIVCPPLVLPSCLRSLETLGYLHLGDLGIPDRIALRQSPSLPQGLNTMKTNLYLVPPNSLPLRNHLVVRDTLRGNSELITRYAKLKREAAVSSFSLDEYCRKKTDFIVNEILMRANDSRISSDELESIRLVNS
jgi:GrpB-like predicted nucleotidyltransferase (UPF0157 family)